MRLGIAALPTGTCLQMQGDMVSCAVVTVVPSTHPKATELGVEPPIQPLKFQRLPTTPSSLQNVASRPHLCLEFEIKSHDICFQPSNSTGSGFQTAGALREYLPIKLPVPALRWPGALI